MYDNGNYNSEIVYGGVDGLITTFAIIAGSVGAELSHNIIIVLGFASILADGFSMGISSFLAERIRESEKHPYLVGLSTFISFIILISMPMIPYVMNLDNSFTYAIVILIFILFLLGLLKGKGYYYGVETAFIGGIAVLIAYQSAKYIHNLVPDDE